MRFCLLLLPLVVACAEGTSSTGDEDDGGGGQAGGGGMAGSAGFAPTGGMGGDDSLLLYVHDDTTLFSANPTESPLMLEQRGDFDCIGGSGQDEAMTDVAVDAEGNIWAVSATAVHRIEIQGTTVHCAQTIELQNPSEIRFYGLTFAPAGVLGANEVLVAGNSAGELWSIDDDGTLQQRGVFGFVPNDDGNGNPYANVGERWELSGDIVFVDGEGEPLGFATVRDCPDPPSTGGCSSIDTLVELDIDAMKTASTQEITKSVRGQIRKADGCVDPDNQGYGSVFGITALETQVFGFARITMGGQAIAMNNADGTACLLQEFTARWAGAGTTTLAPATPPPPK